MESTRNGSGKRPRRVPVGPSTVFGIPAACSRCPQRVLGESISVDPAVRFETVRNKVLGLLSRERQVKFQV